jgi:acetyltransferase-like isoleucine patch superfamily enzyme
MFSFDIDVSTSDRHVVFDFNDRSWLNEPASVLFEPHTWVGMHCNILKGSRTGFGSIIAASAVLAGDVPSCSIFGGIPAKLIRAECSWSRHEVFNDFDVEAVIAFRNLFESKSR